MSHIGYKYRQHEERKEIETAYPESDGGGFYVPMEGAIKIEDAVNKLPVVRDIAEIKKG
jgi:hypothetical protein